MSTRVVHAGDTRGLVYVWCALIGMTVLSVRDMLFITHEALVTVLAVSVRLHMSIISQEGASALMVAARDGHTEVVTQLLEAGANTELQTTKVYTTPCTVCVVCSY